MADETPDIDAILQSLGGADKRLSEHRELVDLLMVDIGRVIERNDWVVSWLEAQDDFLERIVDYAFQNKLIPDARRKLIRQRPDYALMIKK